MDDLMDDTDGAVDIFDKLGNAVEGLFGKWIDFETYKTELDYNRRTRELTQRQLSAGYASPWSNPNPSVGAGISVNSNYMPFIVGGAVIAGFLLLNKA